MSKQIDAFPRRTKRTTFTLPVETLQGIEKISRRMHVAQSALLSELLAEPVASMVSILDLVPEVGANSGDVRRARGRSIELIHNAVAQAQQILHRGVGGESAPETPRRPVRRKRKRGRKR